MGKNRYSGQRKLSEFVKCHSITPLKIGLVGTSLGGRTEIAYTLCAKLQSKGTVYFVTTTNYPSLISLDFQSQYWLLNHHINEELLIQLKPIQFIIVDGTVIDPFASAFLGYQRGYSTSKGDLAVMATQVRYWLTTYDCLFYVNIPFDHIKINGHRDRQTLLAIDAIIQKIISNWGLNIKYLRGSNKDRVQTILHVIFEDLNHSFQSIIPACPDRPNISSS